MGKTISYRLADRFHRLQMAMACLIAFVMPIHKKFVPALIALWGITAIVHGIAFHKFSFPKNFWPLLAMAGIYVLHLLGYFYSEHPANAIKEFEIKMSYLVFPLIGILINQLTEIKVRRIMWWFVYGSLLYMTASVSFGLMRSIIHSDWSYLTYDKLGMTGSPVLEGMAFHPTYAAVYQCFVLGFMMLSASRGEFIFGSRKIHYSVIFLIPVYVSLLASKAGILSVLLVIGWCGWKWWRGGAGRKYTVLFCGGLALLAIVSALTTPATMKRISSAVAANAIKPEKEKTGARNSTELRWVSWSASWQVIKENPFGTGTGDATPELVAIYNVRGEEHAAEKKLNAHNQYLQLAVELGWPCIALLLFLLASLAVYAMKSGNNFMQLFLLLCVFNFLFESFLEVQAGIVFFCFWAMIFTKQSDSQVGY